MLDHRTSELENIIDSSPADMYPTGAHLFGSPDINAQSGSDDEAHHQEFCEMTTATTDVPVPPTDLLGIDEFLKTVTTDTLSQNGRCSVSTAPDIPFKEMTSHFEALSMGKHQKMSVLMSFKHKKQAVFVPNNQTQTEAVYTSNKQNTNPFLEQNLDGYPHSVTVGESPVSVDFQQQFLKLLRLLTMGVSFSLNEVLHRQF